MSMCQKQYIYNLGGASLIKSDTCESVGMRMITSKAECENTAKYLKLETTSAYDGDYGAKRRPCGCLYASLKESKPMLQWNHPDNGCSTSTLCGTLGTQNQEKVNFDCICRGITVYLYPKWHT